jgi:hypothetical protein
MAAVLAMRVERLFNAGNERSQGGETIVMVEVMKRFDRRR